MNSRKTNDYLDIIILSVIFYGIPLGLSGIFVVLFTYWCNSL